MKWFLGFSALLVVFGIIYMSTHLDRNRDYNYIITETGISNSLDPLDADQTNNLPVARMIYATPIEINQKGELSSSVLESFRYDENEYSMEWVVKSGIKYTDNTDLLPSDVAFAVSRMIYARPTFPVIEDILGVSEWIKSKRALETLPVGIQVEENKIKIQFSKKQDHPLFRFCLEIFSIIPKSCVNLENNKIQCDQIPASGHYQLSKKSDNEITFLKRGDRQIFGLKVPEVMTFKYVSNSESVEYSKSMNDQSIITGTDIRFSNVDMAALKDNSHLVYAPASRIVLLLLNPNVGAFKDVKCRQIFMRSFRESFNKIYGEYLESESSVFTDLLPGYLSQDEFDDVSKEIGVDEIIACKSKLQKEPVRWLKAKSNPKSIIVQTMENVFSSLGIDKNEPIHADTQKNEPEMFLKGELSLLGFQTGFWALDPAGDVQMLMTPNMHKYLGFVTEDKAMQKLIRDLKSSGKDGFLNLNRYIYNQALFNVFSHGRRFVAVKDRNILQEAPLSITSPAPWQYFKME